jgi:hypothetical protein
MAYAIAGEARGEAQKNREDATVQGGRKTFVGAWEGFILASIARAGRGGTKIHAGQVMK